MNPSAPDIPTPLPIITATVAPATRAGTAAPSWLSTMGQLQAVDFVSPLLNKSSRKKPFCRWHLLFRHKAILYQELLDVLQRHGVDLAVSTVLQKVVDGSGRTVG